MPEPFAAHFERTHDVLALFESGVFSARVQLLKPEPEIYAHAAAAFGRRPADLLFLDDHWPNIVAAREAGWQRDPFRGRGAGRGRSAGARVVMRVQLSRQIHAVAQLVPEQVT